MEKKQVLELPFCGRIPSGSSILVALSGGPDSVALLHYLCDLAPQYRLKIAAAHVNYKLRGRDSDSDEAFCRELCAKLKVPLFVDSTPSGTTSQGAGQDCYRRRRYGFFRLICKRERIKLIAVGHNQSDHVETVLMNLARGAGPLGIANMARLSDNIIRPLLAWTREDILAYLEDHGLNYRVDASNAQAIYTRNRLRRVLPMLTRIFGKSALANIQRSAIVVGEQEAYLREIGETILNQELRLSAMGKFILDLERLRSYHPMIARLLLFLIYQQHCGGSADFEYAVSERFLDLIAAGDGVVDLKNRLVAEAVNGRVYVYRGAGRIGSLPVRRSGSTRIPRLGLRIRISPVAVRPTPAQMRRSKLTVLVDADKVESKLTVRAPRDGDRFSPLGLKGTKKLSDFLIDRKIDRPLRDELPLLLAGEEIIWVVGCEIGDRVKITQRTTRALKLEVANYRDDRYSESSESLIFQRANRPSDRRVGGGNRSRLSR